MVDFVNRHFIRTFALNHIKVVTRAHVVSVD